MNKVTPVTIPNASDGDTPLTPTIMCIASSTTAVITDINESGDESDDYKNTNSPSSVEPPSQISVDITDAFHIKHKWFKLLTNAAFYGRIFILILSVLLLILSISYCIAQFWNPKLDLVKKCDPKSREQIWKHSYESGLVDGNIILTAESQYGHTKDACFTTKSIDTNTEQLWYTNVYKAEAAKHGFITKSILFALVSIYCFTSIVFNIITIIVDIIYVARDRLHTRSKLYQQYKPQPHAQSPPKVDSCLTRKIRRFNTIWKQLFAADSTTWIISCAAREFMEIIIQTQALLLYNGYNILDPYNKNNIYLANRPHLIQIFSVILAFNCFGAGILWMFYGLAPKKCHGVLFKMLLFFVDQFSDLFYTIFPFIVIFTDSYNANTSDILVLLSQLNLNTTAAFISAFIPLLILCTKSLSLIQNTKKKLRDRYFREWQLKQMIATQMNAKQAPIIHNMSTVNWVEKHANQTKLAQNGNDVHIISNMFKLLEKHNINAKQVVLVLISLIYIMYGIIVLLLVHNHITTTSSYCNLIKESNYFINDVFNNNTMLSTEERNLLHTNPELFLWDDCLVQVLPFTNNDRYKCQCRVVVIDWSYLRSTAVQRKTYFNLTQSMILSNMLEHWYMLEKFRTFGKEGEDGGVTIKKSMFQSIYMKAFEWKTAKINCIENGISAWKQLEYLQFEDCLMTTGVPDDFGELKEMKHLSFKSSGLQFIPQSICNMNQLQVLNIEYEAIERIPSCIAKIVSLNELIIDICPALEEIPLSIFNMPNLVTLSIFHGFINYQSLLENNIPNNINKSNISAVHQWFDDNFTFNTDTTYYLQLNPICNEDMHLSPINLQHLVRASCDFPCNVTGKMNEQFCSPRLLGDGYCDWLCYDCYFDGGDCAQLCFAEQLTNCTYDKLTNTVCDPECDNMYCSTFQDRGVSIKGEVNVYHIIHLEEIIDDMVVIYNSTGDLYHCVSPNDSVIVPLAKTESKMFNVSTDELEAACQLSESVYVANEFREEHGLSGCQVEWIGDGRCDDSCRTQECNNDANDCELGCVNECVSFYQVWNYFVGESVYNANITVLCTNAWPQAAVVFNVDPDPNDCKQKLNDKDFNNDLYMNFREFVSLAYFIGGSPDQKGKQINCSQCIGVEHYNPEHITQLHSAVDKEQNICSK